MLIKGVGVSNGIGMGKAFILPEIRLNTQKEKASPNELERLGGAVARLGESLQEKADKASDAQAEILESHIMLLSDPVMVSEIEGLIKNEDCNSEYAVNEIFEKYAQVFLSSGDELFAARADDLRDIKSNILALLGGQELPDISGLPQGTVLVAKELTTSIAAMINSENVLGIITKEGGKTSHMAIIARSLGLPCVVGISTEQFKNGEQVVLDGGSGEVISNPESDVLNEYEERLKKQREERAMLEKFRGLKSETTDGKTIGLFANIGLITDIQSAVDADAEGVGLFRTEFLYMNRNTPPTEEEQFNAYKKAASAFGGKEVIIRTLDIGGDKEIPYLGLEKEENPFLGWRAIRYCLDKTELFTVQLRAILRATAFGHIKIMIPMISSVVELQKAKALVEKIKDDLEAEEIAFKRDTPVGIMVETPAAAVLADRFALEADFFSIGTNDLTQYTMAVDRGNQHVSKLYSAYDPAVMRLIFQVARAAEKQGIPCGICGEAGADPLLVSFFIGCGIAELSMTGSSILRCRQIVRNSSSAELREKVEKGLNRLSSIDDAVQFLHDITI